MRICGIDYSLTSPALCIGNAREFSVETCHFYYLTKSEKQLVTSTNIYGSLYPDYDCEEERHSRLAEWALTAILKHDVEWVAIEGYAYAAKGKVFNLAENTGLLKYVLWQNQFTPQIFEPQKIKKFATGKGNANKEAMETVFVAETGLDFRSLLGQSAKSFNPSSDLIDGYYIAKLASSLLNPE